MIEMPNIELIVTKRPNMNRKKFIMATMVMIFWGVASSVYAAGVDLAWDAPKDGGPVEGYHIYWKVVDGSYSDNNSMTVAGKTSETVSALDESKSYKFIVKAYNSAGLSPASNEVTWSYADTTPPLQVQGVKAN
jgi:hypothetical protein